MLFKKFDYQVSKENKLLKTLHIVLCSMCVWHEQHIKKLYFLWNPLYNEINVVYKFVYLGWLYETLLSVSGYSYFILPLKTLGLHGMTAKPKPDQEMKKTNVQTYDYFFLSKLPFQKFPSKLKGMCTIFRTSGNVCKII